MRMQDEFNHMWMHSRDFSGSTSFDHVLSSLEITDLSFNENPGVDALFTSFNFDVSGTTFKKTGRNTVSDALVEAVLAAEDRIHIASGHFRLRPLAEALIQKRAEDPDIDIVVYLDSQEYISEWWHGQQIAKLNECLANATTESQIRKCTDKGFLFGYELGQNGIDVVYKYYAYRWHYSYSPQMHNKFLIIDDALYTGSYNLSDNAEHNTFENVTVFEGPEFKPIVDQYEAHFQTLLTTGEGLLPGLLAQVTSGDDFPIVFEPMALRWQEITDLKDAIAENCPAIHSDEYKKNPEDHKWCDK